MFLTNSVNVASAPEGHHLLRRLKILVKRAGLDCGTCATCLAKQDSSGKPLSIDGIWAISPGNASPGNYDSLTSPAVQLCRTSVRSPMLASGLGCTSTS